MFWILNFKVHQLRQQLDDALEKLQRTQEEWQIEVEQSFSQALQDAERKEQLEGLIERATLAESEAEKFKSKADQLEQVMLELRHERDSAVERAADAQHELVWYQELTGRHESDRTFAAGELKQLMTELHEAERRVDVLGGQFQVGKENIQLEAVGDQPGQQHPMKDVVHTQKILNIQKVRSLS
jgi:hypothetical protein